MGRERYDLSDETRNKGLRELTDRGLLDLSRRLFPPPHSSTTASGPATSTSYDPVPGLGLSRSEGRAHREPEHIRLLTPSLGPVGRTRKLWRNEAADTACVTRGSCGNTAVAAVSVNDRFATAVGNCQEV